MLNFYAFLWPWFAASLALGAATGALVAGKPARKGPARWLLWAALACLAALFALALGAVRGAAAMSLESALACFAAFILGCALASFAFRRGFGAHERWALGLVPAALLWWGAAHVAQPAYQAELQKRVAALAEASGVDAAGLRLSGRDVAASPELSENRALLGRIAAAPGVRRVDAAIAPAQFAPPPAKEAGDATATIPQPAPAPAEPPKESKDAAVPAGELDAAACQRALDAVAASDPVEFRAMRSTVNRRVALALDKAAEIIRRCPDATIELRGHGDEGVAEDTLSRRRALAAERYLRREGVAGRRLVAVGCCERPKGEQRAGAIDYIVR